MTLQQINAEQLIDLDCMNLYTTFNDEQLSNCQSITAQINYEQLRNYRRWINTQINSEQLSNSHKTQINSEQLSNRHWIGSKSPDCFKKDGETVHVSAKALNIIWENSDRFWKWIKPSSGESVFPLVAEIIQVSWIEVTGELDLSKCELASNTYEVIFKIKFKDDAFGWHQTPITFEVASPDGKKQKKRVLLETFRGKGNGVHEIHAGEFTPNHSKGILGFGMYETQTPWWKGGLILEEVIVRPKSQ